MVVTFVFAFVAGAGPALALDDCTTTSTTKCTSTGATCTVEKKVCIKFATDGGSTGTITTTTSHDCGTGGPKDCPSKPSSAGLVRAAFPRVVMSETVKTVNMTPRPKPPVKRVEPAKLQKQP